MLRFLYSVLITATVLLHSEAAATDDRPAEISAPPAELKVPAFYTKYISAHGYPIVASSGVDDYALREAAWLVDLMLAERPDVREAMVRSGSRMSIIAWNEFTTDLPEWAWMGESKAVSEVAGHTNSLNFYGQNVEIRRPGADQRRESMSNPEPSSASQIHTTNSLLPGPIKDFLKINSNLISLNFKI